MDSAMPMDWQQLPAPDQWWVSPESSGKSFPTWQARPRDVQIAEAQGWRGTLSIFAVNLFMFAVTMGILTMSRSGRRQLFCFGKGLPGMPGRKFIEKTKRFWDTDVSGDEVRRRCGMEGAFYLVFEQYTTRMFGVMSILGFLLLMPIYIYQSRKHWADVGSFALTTIKDLPKGSAFLWAPASFFYLFTFVFVGYLYLLNAKLQSMEDSDYATSLSSKSMTLQTLSLFVKSGMPLDMSEDKALGLINEICEGYVAKVIIVPKLNSLRKLKRLREAREDDLERLLVLRRRINDGSVPWGVLLCPGNALYPQPQQLCTLDSSLGMEVKIRHSIHHTFTDEREERDRVLAINEGTGRAFLVFTSYQSKCDFCRFWQRQSLHILGTGMDETAVERAETQLDIYNWVLRVAPEPDDIQWSSMSYHAVFRIIWKFLISSFLVLVLVLFTSPTAVVSSVGTLRGFKDIEEGAWSVIQRGLHIAAKFSPHMSNVLFTYIPTLTLMIINTALIQGLWNVTRLEPILTFSGCERKALRVCTIYLIFNTVVLPSLAFGSVDAFVKYMNKESSQVLNTIGGLFFTSSGIFYINYVIQRALLGTAVEMMRLGEVFQFFWLTSRAVTPKEEDEAVEATTFYLGLQYSMFISVVAVVMIFSTMIPLILLAGVLYTFVKHNVDKYQLMYIRPRVPGRGLVGRTALHALLPSFALYQIVMTAYFIARGTKAQAISVLALMLLTQTLCISWYIHDKRLYYGIPSEFMDDEDWDEHMPLNPKDSVLNASLYRDPVLLMEDEPFKYYNQRQTALRSFKWGGSRVEQRIHQLNG